MVNQMKFYKLKRWMFLIASISVLGSLMTLCAAKDDPDAIVHVAWPMDRAGNKIIDLQIPQRYAGTNAAAEAMDKLVYSDRRPHEEQVHRDLLFQVLWPNFETQTDEYHKELYVPGGGRLMVALVKSGSKEHFKGDDFDAIQSEFNRHSEGLRHFCYRNKSDFFDISTPPICVDVSSPAVKPSEFGLSRIGIDFNQHPMPEDEMGTPGHEDLLYAMDANKNLVTFIKCTPDFSNSTAPSEIHHVPQCDHYFYVAAMNAEVSVSYRKEYLKDWQLIQTRWSALLTGFAKSHAATIGAE
jgi:hypothetical protein